MTAGYRWGWVMDMVVSHEKLCFSCFMRERKLMSVLVEEIVFIKSKGTRMTRIRRIRTDLGFLIQIFLSVNSPYSILFSPY